ncbi:DUF1240 domain-containing protein [Proteus mirabilis]|uniref:DUF1240 domain-containing protein n=2 Tax=Proteus mirabilis TaxID=584 RepID=A0A7D6AC62_PROMI|nr:MULTISPECIES: DUF1240 domain-containing protein [Proteus]MBA7799229.1 DUF1240 domain-containing protein [Citrobacter sp. RHBSTW-01065]MCY4917046.1 DUF1240 domain-containing protein [Salmonella enterica subsp. enterica serovar 1,4,[5],12:i:-]EHZ6745259.1 DUF1240 domain-containing protein [Proteus mirabilis]EJD6331740.1 DUF1240 domain-containing protein [Proteus mirabilis]EJD6350647.1 DUF1240 domain-containing protein [Proteus mirabilis]
MPRWDKIIVSIFFLILFIVIGILVYGYTILLFLMEDIIIFSEPIVMLTLGVPLVIYTCFAMTIEFFLGVKSIVFMSLMTFNKLIMRYLVYLGLAGVLLSFPISFVVNIFLLDEGYKTCDKISWLSPTTYVKELSFCNNKKALNK